MFEKITLKFIIIIILLFVFINVYSSDFDKININTINMIERVDLSDIESKAIRFLPYIKMSDAHTISYPIFKTNLDIGN